MLHSLTDFFVTLMRKYLPDAFLFAVILTLIAFGAAWGLTDTPFMGVVGAWGDGLWALLGFAMQMILVLITGHTMASSKPIRKVLQALASIPSSGVGAAMLASFVTALACFLNWGFGLIVGALLARELARRVKDTDYAFTVAAAYSGFVVWHGGLSGSIPLAVATKGHIVEKLLVDNGLPAIIPVSDTFCSVSNLIITGGMIITLPLLIKLIAPAKEKIVPVDPEVLKEPEDIGMPDVMTPATRLEHSPVISILLGVLGLIYLVNYFRTAGFNGLNLNIVIMIFMWAGIILHKNPINYVRAMNEAIKGSAGIAIQFPLYGGIQGIMLKTGLAALIANGFVSISTEVTFPLYTFLAGGIINVFVPSGGGQWIVQGPINIPAGLALGVDPAKVAMSIAYGDQWTNMLQPFWALPLLGIAKLGVRDIMGYCTMTLLWTGAIMALGLLFL